MRAILFVLLLTVPVFLIAQKTSKSIELKFYYGYDAHTENFYQNKDHIWDLTLFSKQENRLGNFIFSLPFPKNKLYQEISISDVRLNWSFLKEIQKNHSGVNVSSAELDNEGVFALVKFMYEIGYNNQSSKRLKPFINAGIEPFFSYGGVQPVIPTIFPVYNTRLGVTFFVVPRLIYEWNDRCYIDLNIPLGVYQMYYNHEKHLNPSLTLEEQNTKYFDERFLTSTWQVRLGLGIRI